MPWVKFWAASNCPSKRSDAAPDHVRYEWFDEANRAFLKDNEALRAEAEDRIPYWLRDASRGCRYGFEILATLPDDVRKELIKDCEKRKTYIDEEIKLYQEKK